MFYYTRQFQKYTLEQNNSYTKGRVTSRGIKFLSQSNKKNVQTKQSFKHTSSDAFGEFHFTANITLGINLLKI